MKAQITAVELRRKEQESIICFSCVPTYLNDEVGRPINLLKLYLHENLPNDHESYGEFITIENEGYYDRNEPERFWVHINYFVSMEYFKLIETDLRAGLVANTLLVKSFDKDGNDIATFTSEFKIRELEFVMTPKIKNDSRKWLSFLKR